MTRVAAALMFIIMMIPACSADDGRTLHAAAQHAHADHPSAHAHRSDVAAPVVGEDERGERDWLPVHSTTTRPAVVRASRSRRAEDHPKVAPANPTPEEAGLVVAHRTARTVSSTAYCETGRMANGQRTYDGAVAMGTAKNPEPPFGTRYRVLSGPYAGRVLTVADRIGHGSQFDIAMPGRCSAALDYGRRQITVERVG